MSSSENHIQEASKNAKKNKRRKEIAKENKAEMLSRISRTPALVKTTGKERRLFEIKPSPGKGVGMFAICDIPKGTEIFREEAICKGENDWLLKEALFMVLNQEQKDSFNDLLGICACGEIPCQETPFVLIHETNCYDCADRPIGQLPPDPKIPDMYLTAARINHDCRPNTAHGFTKDRIMVIRANRNIRSDEEITCNHMGAFGTTAYRRDTTKSLWGFECQCSACQNNKTFTLEETKRALIANKVTTSGGNTDFIGRSTPEEIAKQQEVIAWYKSRVQARGNEQAETLECLGAKVIMLYMSNGSRDMIDILVHGEL